jgi:hypothetical protein
MFLIIAFKKKFTNVMLVPFLELFGQEHNFETWFENVFGNFFS